MRSTLEEFLLPLCGPMLIPSRRKISAAIPLPLPNGNNFSAEALPNGNGNRSSDRNMLISRDVFFGTKIAITHCKAKVGHGSGGSRRPTANVGMLLYSGIWVGQVQAVAKNTIKANS